MQMDLDYKAMKVKIMASLGPFTRWMDLEGTLTYPTTMEVSKSQDTFQANKI